MSKKLLVLTLTAALIAAFSMAPVPAPAAEPIKLTYSCFFPPTHVQSKLADAWCKEVEKRTKGKVKVEYYPGQTLTKAKQVYDGTVQGMSDIGFCLFGYNRGRFPLMEVVDLPLGYPNGKVATQVANAVYKKFNPKELDDVQVMYLHAHGPGLLHTKDKAVKKMEDLKGLKIRSHGTTAKVVEALGGTPVAMPMPELYQALQRGVVDGGMYPLETNKGWRMAEVVKYCTENYANAYTTTFYVVMNKGKWNSLPKDAQEAIIQINEEWIPKHGAAWDESDKVGREFMLKKGRKFIKLSPEESARWKKATDPVLDAYAKETSAKGVPAKEAVEFTKKKLSELSK
ncbi:MAG: TRAP transporter substrate-binding protein [Proteobacteria bacterium]|nr:TRAP transporter substrate-binding protein [Pseudomonadota bacterium]MBU1450814.1 TRAP transporter substrate-binding protein [Pseudomonadota bacterium]MBU2468802.1 TRAP transporter substrate-binding protein [Pseudomonadota bacterium]MBU2516846.1 TRAP transporter substrate-binding protein [Pseudomonadota bacterium]